VIFDGGLTNVDMSGGWKKSAGAYTLGSGGPVIIINMDMGAGNLTLRSR
jgi:hypothetical protein